MRQNVPGQGDYELLEDLLSNGQGQADRKFGGFPGFLSSEARQISVSRVSEVFQLVRQIPWNTLENLALFDMP